MLHRFTQQKKTKMKTFLHCTVDTVLLSLTAVLTKSQVACKTKPDEYLYYEKKKRERKKVGGGGLYGCICHWPIWTAYGILRPLHSITLPNKHPFLYPR